MPLSDVPNHVRRLRLRASWVLPITAQPVENGELILEDNRIVELRPAQPAGSDTVLDFGDTILMPGLINVHTHLDYTVMRGLIEDVEFFPWLRELNERKLALTTDDWQASAIWGAAEAAAGGVTCIGDCTDSGAALHGALALGLRGRIYQEVFGITETPPVAEVVEELRQKVVRMRELSMGSLLEIGISPHAPYTIRPELFTALKDYAESESLWVCIHADESQAEAELLRTGTGSIAEIFKRRGIQWNTPGCSATAYIHRFGILGPRTLLVHGVQVSASDRLLMRETGAAWAFCPKSNAKLGNGVAHFNLLADRNPDGKPAGASPAKIGFGSDGVASNNTMDLFEELRYGLLSQRGARHRIAAMTSRDAIELATIGGARVLGLEDQIGSLEPGKIADLCAVRLDGIHSIPAYDPYNALTFATNAHDVCWTMIDGQVRYDNRQNASLDGHFPGLDIASVRSRMADAVRKMRAWSPDSV